MFILLGVDNDKWYNCKTNVKAAQDITMVNTEISYEAREEVYRKYREEITAQFRCDIISIFLL